MLNLTRQEKSVLLFISAVALFGILINHQAKINPQFRQFLDSSQENTQNPKKVNLNSAGLEDLEKLTGIGPTIAQRILEHRKDSGGFKTIEDIKKVKGIGSRKYEIIKDDIAIE